jgi:ABC-type transport system substrate-binding protein
VASSGAWLVWLAWTGAASGKTPEILIERGPDTIHPLYAWTREDQLLANLVHERLFEPDGKGGWRSDVVKASEVDGAQVTLTLAPLDWHDGRPLVAADVCATVERNKAADRPTPWTAEVRAKVVSCVADDRRDEVVHLTLAAATPSPGQALGFPLIPAHRPEWAGAGPQNALEPIGLGPWAVERDEDGWHLTGGRRAPEKKLDLIVVPDAAAALAQGRGVAVPFVDGADLPALRSHPELRIEVEPASVVWALMVNPTRGPLREAMVREGLDLLIDREALGAALFGRDPDLSTQPWAPVSGPFLPRSEALSGVPVRLRDPEAAALALTEGGLVKTAQGWTWRDQPFALHVVTPLGIGPDPAKLQAALSEQLDGIRVDVSPLSSTQWWFSLLAGAHAPVTDLALVPIELDDLSATFHSRTPTDGIANVFGWTDPQTDAWLGSADPGVKAQLARRLADLHPALFLWVVHGRSAWRTPYDALRGPIVVP